jgi:hypothetical protein
LLYLPLEGKAKGLGEVTGIARGREGKSEKGRRGEREGKGDEKGRGHGRGMKRYRKKGRERWEDGEIEKGHRERKRWVWGKGEGDVHLGRTR